MMDGFTGPVKLGRTFNVDVIAALRKKPDAAGCHKKQDDCHEYRHDEYENMR
jgi:hypothetical protein